MSSTWDQKIWNVVAAIPSGRVASYGQVAELAGIGRAARMIGQSLGRAPDRATLPWHRVLNAQGRISIPKSSRAHKEQIRRLTSEGVIVDNGKVDMKRYRWEPDLDELLWGPAAFGGPAESGDEDEEQVHGPGPREHGAAGVPNGQGGGRGNSPGGGVGPQRE